MQTTGPVPFLFGGHAALDFTNTVNSRVLPPTRDYLPDFQSVLDWCRQVTILPAALLDRIGERAAARPGEAVEAHAEAIVLREAMFCVFRAVACGSGLEPADLRLLDAHARAARAARKLVAIEGGFGLSWREDAASLSLPALAVAAAAEALLTTGALSRVRQCPPPDGCGWLFLDQTRNGSRRWCSMEHCGGAAKARRFAEKHDGRITT